jgi:hypothetical protein
MKRIILFLALLSLGVSKAQVVGGYLPLNSTKSATMGGLKVSGNETVTGTFSFGSTATITGALKASSTMSLGSANLTGGNTGTVAVLSDALFQFTGTGLTAAMADAQTYYFGNAPQTLQTSSVSPFFMPFNATLIGYVANFVVNGGASSAESSTLGINIAGSTTTLNTSITMNAGTGINTFTATGLSINVNSGSIFCPYLITPTWGTNPGTTATGITFLFVRRS